MKIRRNERNNISENKDKISYIQSFHLEWFQYYYIQTFFPFFTGENNRRDQRAAAYRWTKRSTSLVLWWNFLGKHCLIDIFHLSNRCLSQILRNQYIFLIKPIYWCIIFPKNKVEKSGNMQFESAFLFAYLIK